MLAEGSTLGISFLFCLESLCGTIIARDLLSIRVFRLLVWQRRRVCGFCTWHGALEGSECLGLCLRLAFAEDDESFK
jgi:hypothetical protein